MNRLKGYFLYLHKLLLVTSLQIVVSYSNWKSIKNYSINEYCMIITINLQLSTTL